MADGDLLPTSGLRYAVEIRGYLMGHTGVPRIRRINGPGNNRIRRITDSAGLEEGGVNGIDVLEVNTYEIMGWVHVDGVANAEIEIDLMAEAWDAESSLDDIKLCMYRPGVGRKYVLGRPSDLDIDREFVQGGYFTYAATFDATSPRPIPITEDPP